MLGPIRLVIARPRTRLLGHIGLGDRAGSSCEEPWIGAPLGAP